MFRTTHGLGLIVGLLVVASLAPAQDPVTSRPGSPYTLVVHQQNTPVNPLPSHLVLVGSENLPGYGRLAFVLTRGRVQMVDAQNVSVNGTPWINGNRAVFTFKDCVYDGIMTGDVLEGQARFTSGSQVGQAWSYRVEWQR